MNRLNAGDLTVEVISQTAERSPVMTPSQTAGSVPTAARNKQGMILGLHSLLFLTKVKAAAAIMSLNQAHDPLIKLRLTNRFGGSS